MSKQEQFKEKIVPNQSQAKTNIDTENEFAAEFGEGLYGAQAREAFRQHQANKNQKTTE